MKVLETFTFPQEPYLALRWVRGSGLQGVENHLGSLRLVLSIDPTHRIRTVDKPGYCLVLGDLARRRVTVRDPLGHFNPRVIDPSRLSGGSGSGSRVGAAAALRDLTLYQQQQSTRLGAAGGVRGRFARAPGDYLPWVLVSAAHGSGDDAQTFVAQADEKGEIAIDLTGIRRPEDDAGLSLTLRVWAEAGLDLTRPSDPDSFVRYRISPDGETAHLHAELSVSLPQYGDRVNLGDVLIAPTD